MKILLFGDNLGIEQLLKHIPDSNLCGIVGAENRPHYHGQLRAITAERDLPFLVQPLPKRAAYRSFKQSVMGLAPDLIWTNSYSMIIREDILNISRMGGLNIHGALLPEYRGCNPMQWAIINGETQTGVTLHEMTIGVDEGNIVAQENVSLHFQDTWKAVQKRIIAATDALIEQMLANILQGEWVAIEQDASRARYHRRRKPEDGQFYWHWPAVEIYNLIRALVKPHPGAFYIDTVGDTVVIDEYRSLGTVMAMKYEKCPEHFLLENGRYRLRPLISQLISEVPSVNSLRFEISQTSTSAHLASLELDLQDILKNKVALSIDANLEDLSHMPDLQSSLLEWVSPFCLRELKASLIAVAPNDV